MQKGKEPNDSRLPSFYWPLSLLTTVFFSSFSRKERSFKKARERNEGREKREERQKDANIKQRHRE